MVQTNEDLVRRVEQLEKDSRLWKRVSAGALCLWLLVGGARSAVAQHAAQVFSGFAVNADQVTALELAVVHKMHVDGPAVFDNTIEAGTIYASSIVIRDREGKTTAILGGLSGGERSLAFYGKQPNDKPQVELEASDNGASLSLRNANAPNVSLRSGAWLSGLSVLDVNGKMRLTASLSNAAAPGGAEGEFKLDDGAGKHTGVLSQNKDGASLHLYGENGSASLNTADGFYPGPGLALEATDPVQAITVGFANGAGPYSFSPAPKRPLVTALGADHKPLWQLPESTPKKKH